MMNSGITLSHQYQLLRSDGWVNSASDMEARGRGQSTAYSTVSNNRRHSRNVCRSDRMSRLRYDWKFATKLPTNQLLSVSVCVIHYIIRIIFYITGNVLLQNKGSTNDAANNPYVGNCALGWHSGGWWFTSCGNSDLNAKYRSSHVTEITWYGIDYMVTTEMKIRPL